MGKESDKPDAPDYSSLARQTSALQEAAANRQTWANRVNQIGPQGSITWSNNPTTSRQFDADAYAAALEAFSQASQGKDQWERVYDPNWGENGGWTMQKKPSQAAVAPNREDFYRDVLIDNWTQTTSLSPEQQALYDAQQALQQNLMGQIGGAIGKPLDFSNLPSVQGFNLHTGPAGGQMQGTGAMQNMYTKPMQVPNVGGMGGGGQTANSAQKGGQQMPQPGGGGQMANSAQKGGQQMPQPSGGGGQIMDSASRAGQMSQAQKGGQQMPMPGAGNREMMMQQGGGMQTATGGGPAHGDVIGQNGYANIQGMPQAGFGAVQQIQDAMMGRLGSSLQQGRDAEMQRLKAQGITEGTPAWQAAMQSLNQKDVDSNQQALLGAMGAYGDIFNRDLQARQQGISEAQLLRSNSIDDRQRAIQEMLLQRQNPMNEYAALLSGTGVQMPSFAGYTQATGYNAPDLMGAANSQYQDAMGRYNAQQASNASAGSGIGTILGGITGAFLGDPLLGAALGGTAGGALSR